MNNAAKTTKKNKNLSGSFSVVGRCPKCNVMFFHGCCGSCAPEAVKPASAVSFQGATLLW